MYARGLKAKWPEVQVYFLGEQGLNMILFMMPRHLDFKEKMVVQRMNELKKIALLLIYQQQATTQHSMTFYEDSIHHSNDVGIN